MTGTNDIVYTETMSGAVYIYVLKDPEKGSIRYVGKTYLTLKSRLARHLAPSELRKNTRKINWIKSLKARGLRPTIELLDIGDADTWEQLEKFYIAALRCAGFDLTNGTEGGDGQSKGYQAPPEVKQRLSAMRKGLPHSPDHRKAIAAAKMGHPVSEKTRRKLSEALRARGNTLSPEHIEKMRVARQSKRISGESTPKTHCLRGHPFSPENTWLGHGQRQCRTCNRERAARLRAEKKGKQQ